MTFDTIEAARAWKKNELRLARSPILERLDVEFIRELEKGNLGSPEIQAIIARKNVLRAVTDLVDEAATIAEVEAIKLPS